MRKKRRMVIVGLVAGSWLAIACSSGSGGIIALGDGYDTPPNSRDKPGPGRETPPSSVDNPGNQGGGGGGRGGGEDCPPCDGKLSCVVDGKKTTLKLTSDSRGACSVGEGVTLDCSGRVLQDGAPIGTWSGANGNYTIEALVDGKRSSFTCTSAPPSTDTPTPTPTPTAAPKDAGTVTKDAATKG